MGRDGKVYLLSDRGEIHCLEAKTGKDLWKGAIPRSSANFYSSPILAGDLLYAAREDGMVAVVKVGDSGMEVLSQNEMGERIGAAPVPVRNKLLIRGRRPPLLPRREVTLDGSNGPSPGMKHALLALPLLSVVFASADEFRLEQREDRLVITDGPTPVAEYVFKDGKILRPYFANVHAPGGIPVTRTHPPDPERIRRSRRHASGDLGRVW